MCYVLLFYHTHQDNLGGTLKLHETTIAKCIELIK